MNSKFLECWHLRKEFVTDKGKFLAVKEFTLNVAEGEFISVIGHSGCGKSTALSMIAGIYPFDGGGMILDNIEVTGPGTDRAVVFQSPNLLPWLTAVENVMLAVEQVMPKATFDQRHEAAAHWLARVGLRRSLNKRPRGVEPRYAAARRYCSRIFVETQSAAP